jgi:hypothetical protein
MDSVVTALIVFAVIVTSTLVGALLRSRIPTEQVTGETWSSVSLGIGFIATMAAIVLGLLVASAKGSYDTKREELQTAAAKVIVLDRTLRQYGPETQPIRAMLQEAIKARSDMQWVAEESTSEHSAAAAPDALYGYEQLWLALRTLAPANDMQRALQVRGLDLIDQLGQLRWQLIAQSSDSISRPLLFSLVTWLAVIAGCAAVFAPRHRMMLVVAVLCALAISGTIFLVMELYNPFGGVMRVSNAPIQTAIDLLSRP